MSLINKVKNLQDIIDFSEARDANGLFGVTINISRWEEWSPAYELKIHAVAHAIHRYVKENELTLRWYKGPAHRNKWADQRYWAGAYRSNRKSDHTNEEIIMEVLRYVLWCRGPLWFKKEEDRNAFLILFGNKEVISMEAYNRD